MEPELSKWKKERQELSNGIWKVTLTHTLGASVEKIGGNLENLEKEVEISALEIDKQLEQNSGIH